MIPDHELILTPDPTPVPPGPGEYVPPVEEVVAKPIPEGAIPALNNGWLLGSGKRGVGRPKDSTGPKGRAAALGLLDKMLGTEENKEIMLKAFEDEFRKNPVKFFRKIVMPLLPKTAILAMGEGQAVKWTSLLTTFPTEPSETSTLPEESDSASSAVDVDSEKRSLPPPSGSTSSESEPSPGSTPG